MVLILDLRLVLVIHQAHPPCLAMTTSKIIQHQVVMFPSFMEWGMVDQWQTAKGLALYLLLKLQGDMSRSSKGVIMDTVWSSRLHSSLNISNITTLHKCLANILNLNILLPNLRQLLPNHRQLLLKLKHNRPRFNSKPHSSNQRQLQQLRLLYQFLHLLHQRPQYNNSL